MSIVAENLRRAVHSRAGGACEYCLIPESAGFYTHEIDHVVALKHGGKSELGNLALACLSCNRHKGSEVMFFSRDIIVPDEKNPSKLAAA